MNLDSVQIAKELMLAQEVADLHCARIDTAIDAAAASGGDPVAIDEAVAAVAAAEQANVAELTLSKAWGTHLGEVYRLVEVAEELLGGLEARARAGANA